MIEEAICRIVKVNALCWKIYLLDHFVGSENTEQRAQMRADSLAASVRKFAADTRKPWWGVWIDLAEVKDGVFISYDGWLPSEWIRHTEAWRNIHTYRRATPWEFFLNLLKAIIPRRD